MKHCWHVGAFPRELAIMFVMTTTFAGCTGDQSAVAPAHLPAITSAVTGPAADRLNDQGQFTLNDPLILPYPQITADRAIALADAFRSEQLRSFIPALEEDRGAGIEVKALKRCGRTYYAEPAIDPLPPNVHPGVRRAHGPHWIVNYCGDSGQPEVSLAVSAFATDLEISNGRLAYPVFGGGEYFHPLGIPKGRTQGLPGSPESAAIEIAARSGARVIAVPRLIMLPRALPQLSFWRVELERAVPARGMTSKRVTQVTSVYFSDDSRLGHQGRWIAQVGGPHEFEYVWPISMAEPGKPASFSKGRASARAGFPIRLEPVEETKR